MSFAESKFFVASSEPDVWARVSSSGNRDGDHPVVAVSLSSQRMDKRWRCHSPSRHSVHPKVRLAPGQVLDLQTEGL